jgi:protease secretion system outer membrane protein
MKSQWKRFGVLSSTCLVLALPMQANAIGLLEAYIAALKNDPIHRAAKAELIAGLEYEAIGRSALLPTVQYSY